MVRRLLPLSLTLLAGCALSPPLFAPATPMEVQVPVIEPIYCTPPPRTNPTLPIGSLSATALPADTMRAKRPKIQETAYECRGLSLRCRLLPKDKRCLEKRELGDG
jgi:hypothetical protein